MAKKMQISDDLVNKHKSSVIFWRFSRKKARVGTFRRDGRVTASIDIIFDLILLKKVISLKNAYINESNCLWTLKIYTVCQFRIEGSHTVMEISLNLMGFTDFFYKEMLNNLISFSSSHTFSFNVLLKASTVWAKKL